MRISYFIYLSFRYTKNNILRTIYSILGIMLSILLCYSAMTVAYSCMEHQYLEEMKEYHGCQLLFTTSLESQKEFDEAVSALEALDVVKKVYVEKFPKEDMEYIDVFDMLHIEVKKPDDLAGCEREIEEKTGYNVKVHEGIGLWLAQGSSEEGTLVSVLIVIIGALFAAFSMFIVRNTMMISVLERMRDYGILRCVGMSKKQLRELLCAEGIGLALISVVLGTGVGFGLLKLLEPWINRYLEIPEYFSFGFYPKAVVYAGLMCVGVTLFALLEPGRQACNQPVDAVLLGSVYGKKEGMGCKRKKKGRQEKAFGKTRKFTESVRAEWEYAWRNMRRYPARALYLFLGTFTCTMLLGGVLTGVSSTYATLEDSCQGKRLEYPEFLRVNQPYSAELAEQLIKDVAVMDGVKSAGLQISRSILLKMNNEEFLMEINAYDREHIEGLQKYVTEGKISYEEMVQKKGVVISDYKYNVRDKEQNFTDVRKTDLKVGDKIQFPSPEAVNRIAIVYEREYEKAGYYRLNQSYEKEVGGTDGNGAEEKEEEYEKKYDQARKKMLKGIIAAGYPLDEYSEDYVSMEIFDIQNAMEQVECERGNKEEYVIQGIVSEDIYNSGAAPEESVAQVMIPAELVLEQPGYVTNEEKVGVSGGYCWRIGLKRDIREITSDVRQYCKEKSMEKEGVSYELCQFNKDVGGYVESGVETEQLDDTNRILHMVQMVGIGVAVFIVLICLIQIFNTACANMMVRKKELLLYRAVGMSCRQMNWMIVLEYGFVCFFGILSGYLVMRFASWYFLVHILNEDGSIFYRWPAGEILAGCAVIFAACLLTGRLAAGKGRRL